MNHYVHTRDLAYLAGLACLACLAWIYARECEVSRGWYIVGPAAVRINASEMPVSPSQPDYVAWLVYVMGGN